MKLHSKLLSHTDVFHLPPRDQIEATKREKAILDGRVRVASSSGKPRHMFTLEMMQEYIEILINAEILADSVISWTRSPEGAAHRRALNSAYQDMRKSLNEWLEECPLARTNQGKAVCTHSPLFPRSRIG